jgi:hypothetical protein
MTYTPGNGGSAGVATSNTGCTCGGWYVGDFPPPPCAMHALPAWHDARPLTYQPIVQPPAPLSDADVERIARRVAELLREAKP